MFLMWYDPDKKKSPVTKILDAAARYLEKFGHAPKVVLVNVADVCEVADLEVFITQRVPPNTFQVGEWDA